MARTKQTNRNLDRTVLRQPGEWKEWRRRNPIEDILKLSASEVSAIFKSMEASPEYNAAFTLLTLATDTVDAVEGRMWIPIQHQQLDQ